MSFAYKIRSPFAPAFGLAMLVVLVVGFGPSFFFRPWSGRPALPMSLVLHGIAGTAWFALFIAQALLVAKRRVVVHRRLGIAGVVIALLVVVTGAQATLAFTRTLIARGDFVAANGTGEEFVYWALATSWGGLAMFAVLVGVALALRRRPPVHGRLMLLATSGLVGPAAARIVGWFAPLPTPWMAVTFVFLATLVVHDVRTRGRPHVATIAGGAFSYGLIGALMAVDFGRWAMGATAG